MNGWDILALCVAAFAFLGFAAIALTVRYLMGRRCPLCREIYPRNVFHLHYKECEQW